MNVRSCLVCVKVETVSIHLEVSSVTVQLDTTSTRTAACVRVRVCFCDQNVYLIIYLFFVNWLIFWRVSLTLRYVFQISMSACSVLVFVDQAPAITHWETTHASAHRTTCQWTEDTAAWVCEAVYLLIITIIAFNYKYFTLHMCVLYLWLSIFWRMQTAKIVGIVCCFRYEKKSVLP